jgi:hypothetical protein
MKIKQFTVQQKCLSTVEAELWIVVETEDADATTHLRGSLVGPKCAGVETVQITYPLKPIPPSSSAGNVVAARVVIPDPNLSTQEMPFVYEGNVELWHEGKCTDTKPVRATFKTKTNREMPAT